MHGSLSIQQVLKQNLNRDRGMPLNNVNGNKKRNRSTNKRINNDLRFAIHTLGCKVNQYESEKIIAGLKDRGWILVDFPSSKADVHIINTCTVTAVANHKSRQLIRRAINGNPNSAVIVTGCYADSDKAEIQAIEGVDLVVGNDEKTVLPGLIATRFGVKTISRSVEFDESAREQPQNTGSGLRTRAFVKVQDGCNNFCTYCIVPYVRGDLRSRPVEEVVDEVEGLVSTGTKEVVLTGIHLGLYGAGANRAAKGAGLGDLVERLIQIPNIGRIRLSSIELNEITPKIVELISVSGKLCNHLHIPLQSGSNGILKRMNRRYTADEFIDRAIELKLSIANSAITTDVIVGFPGETDRDFEETVRTIEAVGFSKLHVFKYSPRKGTPAASYPDQISNKIKDARSSILIDLGKRLSEVFASRFVDKKLTVLIERENERLLTGISDNYIRVACRGDAKHKYAGELVTVAMNGQEEEKLIGDILI
jgi:threonylcarbamoyladenosine tRNA methylthiotransferase MtaB